MKQNLLQIYYTLQYHYVKLAAYIQISRRRELKKFKNKHKGERCFIIGNGPSLDVKDLDLLKDEYTFSCNMIYRLLEQTEWKPYYYFVHDPKYVAKHSKEIQNVECKNRFIGFYSSTYKTVKRNFNKSNEQVNYYLDKKEYVDKMQNVFSEDVSKVVNAHGSVSHAMLQFAIYMGFQDIYLLGFDHSFSKQVSNGKVVKNNVKSHFEGYNVINDNAIEIDMLNNGFNIANIFSETKNVKIYNATKGGNLEIFERVKFNNLF